jgi:filamentous hemagglutinin
LANVMFWQPMWAQADGIVVATPGTSLGQAGNGVPIIQIATPNGTGLSHNQFHDYNVGTQGVILNNVANQTGATQLGGIIIGNPNLTNGVAAQTILNEVVGGSPSQLRGYTEVAGQSARVIVANPYGISCNGCGFINTPRVTLTTGKPVLDNGRLDRFQVDQGSVSIDGAGLNANNVDQFEIITRSAKINAEIQAKNLTIVAGRNDVNADSLNATARADDGSAKPQLAIDSSALGGRGDQTDWHRSRGRSETRWQPGGQWRGYPARCQRASEPRAGVHAGGRQPRQQQRQTARQSSRDPACAAGADQRQRPDRCGKRRCTGR